MQLEGGEGGAGAADLCAGCGGGGGGAGPKEVQFSSSSEDGVGWRGRARGTRGLACSVSGLVAPAADDGEEGVVDA